MKRKLLSLSLFVSIFCSPVFSQEVDSKKIEILNANSLEYDDKFGRKAKRLIGDVQFKHNDVLMFCDSALFYSEKNALDAYGHVRINQGDSIRMTGDSLFYDGNKKTARFKGNIMMTDRNIILTTTQLDYDLNTKKGYYLNGGKIVNKKEQNTLTSTVGYYQSDARAFFFRKNVKLVNKDYTITADTLKYDTDKDITVFLGPTNIVGKKEKIYCEKGWFDSKREVSIFSKNAKFITKGQELRADSIYYDKKIGLGKSYRNVIMEDSVEKTTVTGDFAIFNEKDSSSLITGKVLMTQFFDKDTFYLHADTLIATNDTSGKKRILAFYKVRFMKSDLQGQCDSLVFNDADSTIRMFNTPILWSEKDQLTADFITIKRDSSGMRYMNMENNAFIISQEDSLRFNQIKGKNMIGFFQDDELRKVDVKNNGQVVYFAYDDDNKFMGLNKTVCTDMRIYLDSSKVRKITFYQQPSATVYPPKEIISSETTLDGFKWFGEIKPKKKEDLFVWPEVVK